MIKNIKKIWSEEKRFRRIYNIEIYTQSHPAMQYAYFLRCKQFKSTISDLSFPIITTHKNFSSTQTKPTSSFDHNIVYIKTKTRDG